LAIRRIFYARRRHFTIREAHLPVGAWAAHFP